LSACQGNPFAQFPYDFMLFHRDGTKRNKSPAAHHLTLSDDQDHAEAQFKHGFMLYGSDGIEMTKSPAF
jgi:TPR repeat protein